MVIDLAQFENKVCSQNGEDGIIQKILETIGIETGTYVEIGVENGTECNCRHLFNNGFKGIMFDGRFGPIPQLNLFKQYFTRENVLDVLKRFRSPISVDVFSLDTDLNDYYFMREILKVYRPRVIVVEYNSIFPPDEDKVVHYDPTGFWDGTNYQHATLLSWHKLFRKYGYSLVYCEKEGINAFFVNDAIMPANVSFANTNDLAALYKKRVWDTPDKLNRTYTSHDEIEKNAGQ